MENHRVLHTSSLDEMSHLNDNEPTTGITHLSSAAHLIDMPGAGSFTSSEHRFSLTSADHAVTSAKFPDRPSDLLKGKSRESKYVAKREDSRPLQLLDLPVDVLKEIIKEVTHTNDLASVALTHSALHNLAIPYIYSRFDIVWPDAHTTSDPRPGVDALTYGLATLVMDEAVFGENTYRKAPPSDPQFNCYQCGALNRPKSCAIHATSNIPIRRRRRGNYFAQYTRKFSLGNGPPEWVAEYMMHKESGKMLGTLVALAIARMRNLETFVWDMPTGILRDVWVALSSLGDRYDGSDCRLERVAVRWHDTALEAAAQGLPNPHSVPLSMSHTIGTSPIGILVASSDSSGESTPQPGSYVDHGLHRNSFPNFSTLPPLKSLSVLDIDDLAYLDEMSILIEKSKDRLRELRVGIAPQAVLKEWTFSWDGEDIRQLDPLASWNRQNIHRQKRLGGVLGVLVGRFHEIKSSRASEGIKRNSSTTVLSNNEKLGPNTTVGAGYHSGSSVAGTLPLLLPLSSSPYHPAESIQHSSDVIAGASPTDISQVGTTLAAMTLSNSEVKIVSHASQFGPVDSITRELQKGSEIDIQSKSLPHNEALEDFTSGNLNTKQIRGLHRLSLDAAYSHGVKPLEGKLKLETLELERVPLCVAILQKAFDWTVLTSLTILSCSQHEQLWKTLRRSFVPIPQTTPYSLHHRPHFADMRASIVSTTRSTIRRPSEASLEYRLRLKKIHVDAVSPSLVSFIRETLAPNSLETLFLHEGVGYISAVTIDQIFRGPLRRHRASLKRLSIDSSDRRDAPGASAQRWKKWLATRDVLSFITSGKMSNLRELALAVDYKDWHFFLQRLPLIPHVRSLYIPHIADHVSGSNLDPKELAMQVVDIVTLCPEVDICYIGIITKCFEILENKGQDDRPSHFEVIADQPSNAVDVDSDEEEDIEEDDDDEDEADEDDLGTTHHDPDETESEFSSDARDESDDEAYATDDKGRPNLRLREILFYDDKVSIFKARHGRL